MDRFDSWAEVVAWATKHGWLYYHAPLDQTRTWVNVVRVYKNGKLRLDPQTCDTDPFTADAGHLDRMRRPRY